jgi:hypothetical protein
VTSASHAPHAREPSAASIEGLENDLETSRSLPPVAQAVGEAGREHFELVGDDRPRSGWPSAAISCRK